MVRFCKYKGIYTFFPTNSSSLTENTITDMVNAGFGTIFFSLDEVPGIDSSIRGIKRHFDMSLKSIRALKKARGNKKHREKLVLTESRDNHESCKFGDDNIENVDQELPIRKGGISIHEKPGGVSEYPGIR